MRNIKLMIEYDGRDFNGWQKQPNRLNIQGTIEKAIQELTKEEVDLIASGRTDAGVHAFGQVANFKTNTKIPIEKMVVALNSVLKKSILIKDAKEMPDDFHSRYHSKQKTYRYIIDNSALGSSIYRYLECHVIEPLEVEKMKEAASYFEGEHDFKAFKSSGTSSKSSVRTIYKAKVEKIEHRIFIEITGNGFLYNMVRIIAGTLVEVGLGKIKVEDIPMLIEKGERVNVGKILPAHGLYLMEVKYT